MDQDASCREVGLSPSNIVRWGPSSTPPKGGGAPQFLACVYCGQTPGCIKMPLGMEVDLSPGHIVLDGDPAPPPLHERGTAAPSFQPMSTVTTVAHHSYCWAHFIAHLQTSRNKISAATKYTVAFILLQYLFCHILYVRTAVLKINLIWHEYKNVRVLLTEWPPQTHLF